jgi:hypothetical protein
MEEVGKNYTTNISNANFTNWIYLMMMSIMSPINSTTSTQHWHVTIKHAYTQWQHSKLSSPFQSLIKFSHLPGNSGQSVLIPVKRISQNNSRKREWLNKKTSIKPKFSVRSLWWWHKHLDNVLHIQVPIFY